MSFFFVEVVRTYEGKGSILRARGIDVEENGSVADNRAIERLLVSLISLDSCDASPPPHGQANHSFSSHTPGYHKSI